MHTRIVAQAIHYEIAIDNLDIFRRRYFETEYRSVTNPGFRRAMELAQHLSESDRSTLLEIIRQVSVDTASTVLGILEGTVVPDQIEGEISVIYDDEDISDEIQSMFLIVEEEYQNSLMRGA